MLLFLKFCCSLLWPDTNKEMQINWSSLIVRKERKKTIVLCFFNLVFFWKTALNSKNTLNNRPLQWRWLIDLIFRINFTMMMCFVWTLHTVYSINGNAHNFSIRPHHTFTYRFINAYIAVQLIYELEMSFLFIVHHTHRAEYAMQFNVSLDSIFWLKKPNRSIKWHCKMNCCALWAWN